MREGKGPLWSLEPSEGLGLGCSRVAVRHTVILTCHLQSVGTFDFIGRC